MKFSTHIIVGVTLAVIALSFIGSPIDLVVAASVSSLLPDIDHPKSFIGSRFFTLSKYIRSKWGNRTITHSIFAAVLVPFFITWPFYVLFQLFDYQTSIGSLILGSFIGYLSHLMVDALNLQGIELFYPVSRRRLPMYKNKAWSISVGSADEDWFRFFTGVICFLLITKHVWNLVEF